MTETRKYLEDFVRSNHGRLKSLNKDRGYFITVLFSGREVDIHANSLMVIEKRIIKAGRDIRRINRKAP